MQNTRTFDPNFECRYEFAGKVSKKNIRTGVSKTGKDYHLAEFIVTAEHKGQKQTTYVSHKVKCWGNAAIHANETLQEGDYAYILADKYLQDSWDDKQTGQKRYSNYFSPVKIERIEGAQQETPRRQPSAAYVPKKAEVQTTINGHDGFEDDDIPF